MPIFEYRCDDCGARFEKLVRNSDARDGLTCPTCGAIHLTQQLSTFATHAGGKAEPMPGGCPSGMCPHPSLCGRN